MKNVKAAANTGLNLWDDLLALSKDAGLGSLHPLAAVFVLMFFYGDELPWPILIPFAILTAVMQAGTNVWNRSQEKITKQYQKQKEDLRDQLFDLTKQLIKAGNDSSLKHVPETKSQLLEMMDITFNSSQGESESAGINSGNKWALQEIQNRALNGLINGLVVMSIPTFWPLTVNGVYYFFNQIQSNVERNGLKGSIVALDAVIIAYNVVSSLFRDSRAGQRAAQKALWQTINEVKCALYHLETELTKLPESIQNSEQHQTFVEALKELHSVLDNTMAGRENNILMVDSHNILDDDIESYGKSQPSLPPKVKDSAVLNDVYSSGTGLTKNTIRAAQTINPPGVAKRLLHGILSKTIERPIGKPVLHADEKSSLLGKRFGMTIIN